MTDKTLCPRRLKPGDGTQFGECRKDCELYVKLKVDQYPFEGCAEHVQARLLGVIASRLKEKY